MTVTIHSAPVVVPVSSEPLADGAVAVSGDRIVAVGPTAEVVAAHPGAGHREWTGALMPGLVNAHTHLQYTSFVAVGADPHPTYVDWSARFVDEYEARRGEDWRAGARAGLEASVAAGVTCLADIVTDVEAMDVLFEAGVSGVTYYEIIGVDMERWEGGVAEQVTHILSRATVTEAARVGLSPHAPYSIDAPVLGEAAGLARRLGVRLHVHLAESDTEDAFYRTGTGALAERVASRVRRPWAVLTGGGVGLGAAEFAEASGLLGRDSHMAHGVYLGSAGRRLLAARGTYVALCPRSNLTVGIDPPPVADYLRERGLIAVGTDSLASTRSLDLMEDVGLLRQLAVAGGYDRADLDRRLLEAATRGGAAALGLDRLLGTLEAGKRADLAVFEVEVDPRRVERSLVESGAGACVATVVAGQVR